MPFGDVGGIGLDYPAVGPKSPWLASWCEIALEVSYDNGLNWTEPNNARYLRLRRKGDQVDKPKVVTYEGPGYVWLLDKAKVLPEGKLNADGTRAFLSANPGTILRTLLLEAQARGELPGMDVSTFNEDHDSNGTAWAKVITLYYEPGVSYLTILLNLHDQGLLDFTMAGRSLGVYNADTVMAGDSGARLLKGRDLTEAPYTATGEGIASHVFLAGDKGLTFERTNATAPQPWGRWTEFISQGGVSDTGTMTVLTDAALDLASAEREENTYGLTFDAAKYLPFRDYGLGKDVTVVTDEGQESLRLRQITLERDTEGRVKGNVVLNDRFLENEVRQNRRVKGITGGATTDGGSGAQPAPAKTDKLAPKAPTGLAFASSAYLDDAGKVWALVTLNWAAPTQNTDGTALTDLTGYEVYYRMDGDTTWVLATLTDAGVATANISALRPNTNYQFAVKAYDDAGNRSAFSATGAVVTANDAIAPGKPSTPVVTPYLGQLLIEWDGLLATGAVTPIDLARAEIHLTTTNVAPVAGDVATLVDTITSRAGGSTVATGLTYGATYYAWIILVDRAGNVSPVSTSATGVPPKAGPGDVSSITANQITAGAISAAITVSGRIATALTGARVEINSGGIKSYNASGVLTVDIPVSGTPVFSGTLKSAQTGARVEIGDSITLGGTVPSGVMFLYSGVASETSPGQIYTAVSGTGSGSLPRTIIASPRKNNRDAARIELYAEDTTDGSAEMYSYVATGKYVWDSTPTWGAHYFTAGGVDWGLIHRNQTVGMSIGNGAGTVSMLTSSTSFAFVYPTDGIFDIQGSWQSEGGTFRITETAGTDRRLSGGLISGLEYVQSDTIYKRTGTAVGAVNVNSSGTLYRVSSSERYKVNIDRTAAEQIDTEAVLALQPAYYYDKGDSERLAEYLERLADGDDSDDFQELDRIVTMPTRNVGLIAEDVAALGLDDLVQRGPDGRPEGVHYDRLGVMLLPIVKDLVRRVRDLEIA
jgi:hypothetical protein